MEPGNEARAINVKASLQRGGEGLSDMLQGNRLSCKAIVRGYHARLWYKTVIQGYRARLSCKAVIYSSHSLVSPQLQFAYEQAGGMSTHVDALVYVYKLVHSMCVPMKCALLQEIQLDSPLRALNTMSPDLVHRLYKLS